MIGILEVNAAVDFERDAAELREAGETPVILGREFQARKLGCFAYAIAE